MNNPEEVLERLRSPKTIRQQAHRLLDLAKAGKLAHFIFNPKQMQATASFVVEVITKNYPTLQIPYHSRWRHLEVRHPERSEGSPGNREMSHYVRHDVGSAQHDVGSSQHDVGSSQHDIGIILYELIIISVFLDAGAGNAWRYKDPLTGKEYSRSEGLALASLAMYQNGAFSAHPEEPYRVDAERLLHFKEEDLQQGFQISEHNPLAGANGRLALLNQLGVLLKEKTKYFGTEGRLGHFYSYVCSLITPSHFSLSTVQLFQAVLDGFNDIWPARVFFEHQALGDVWIHKALKTEELGSEYIPFHKLSQWLTYSLIEPLEQTGIEVYGIEQLTGLAEYRNGGLLLDCGLLQVRNEEVLFQSHEPGSELIVEWRGLTVALLDELAVLIREQLQQNEKTLPLAKILQGGTWEAGRQIAQSKRRNGTPPLQIISDGTVF